MTAYDIGTWILLGAGLPLAWTSVVLHLRTPWWRTEMGRHMLTFALVLAVVFSFGTVRQIVGADPPAWLQFARLIAFAFLVVAMGWRVVLQLEGRKVPAKD